MTKDEVLEQEIFDQGIELIEKYNFESPNIKGLYCDKVIALNDSIESKKEKSCVLAEELGHHYLTYGDILDQSKAEHRKQEYKARLHAYNKQIGLTGIVKAYEAGCINVFEMAEYLDVTEEFLNETLNCYRSKYGQFVEIDNCIIYFEPHLGVFKLIQ